MFDKKIIIPIFRPPIMQYTEIIPQTWWQKLARQKPKQRLRIKRSMPQHYNCRCSMVIFK